MNINRRLENHPWWQHFSAALSVEAGTLLASGHKHRRIELLTEGFTDAQVAKLLAMQVRCANCMLPIHPFRRRKGKSAGRAERPSRLFVALTCELQDKIGCSRGKAATEAYERVIKALEKRAAA